MSTVEPSAPPVLVDTTKTLQRRSAAVRAGSVEDVKAALRADPLYSTVSDILHWREPVRSALVFAIIVLAWFLLAVAEYSALTLVAYLYLGLFLGSFGLVQYSNFSGKPHLLKARLGEISDVLPREQSQGHAETAYKVVDSVTNLARDALFFTDVAFSLKAFGLALALAVFGNLFSIPTLFLIAAIIFFIVPRVYEEKQEQIDAIIAQALAAANEKLGPVLAKVPTDKLKLKQE